MIPVVVGSNPTSHPRNKGHLRVAFVFLADADATSARGLAHERENLPAQPCKSVGVGLEDVALAGLAYRMLAGD